MDSELRIQLKNEMIIDMNKLSRELADILKFIKTSKSYNQGLDFLQVKNHVFMSYLTNVAYILNRKMMGKSIKNEGALKRIIESRVYLEKMANLEKKLKNTIDSQLKQLHTINTQSNEFNLLNFKPNISNMIMPDETEENFNHQQDISNGNKETTEGDNNINILPKSQKYVPPKRLRVPYPGDNSNILPASKTKKDLLSDNDDDDGEFFDTGSTNKIKFDKVGPNLSNDPTLFINNDFDRMEKVAARKEKQAERQKLRAHKIGLLDELRHQYGDRPEEQQEYTSHAKKALKREMDHRMEYEEDYMIRLNVTKKDKHKMRLLNAGAGALDDITDFRDYRDLMVEAAEEENTRAKSRKRHVKFSSSKSFGKKKGGGSRNAGGGQHSFRAKKGKKRMKRF